MMGKVEIDVRLIYYSKHVERVKFTYTFGVLYHESIMGRYAIGFVPINGYRIVVGVSLQSCILMKCDEERWLAPYEVDFYSSLAQAHTIRSMTNF